MNQIDNINVIDKVESILKYHPETRDNDWTLWVEFLKRYHPKCFDGDGHIIPNECYNVPLLTHTTRNRAKIQNNYKRYLPLNWEVAKLRGINEITWHNYINENKLSNKDQLSLIG